MTKQSIAKFGVLSAAILAIPAISLAGTASAGKDKNPIEKCKESCITGDIGIDIVSMYISRGIPRENQGAILQPYMDLSFKFYQGDGALTKVSLDLGFWESFNSRHTGAPLGETTRAWFESDFTTGLSFVINKNLTINPYYRAYMSPNDAFETAQAVGLRLAFDDTDFLGAFALHPYAVVQYDVDNSSGNGKEVTLTPKGFRIDHRGGGVYYEVGITPGVKAGPVDITLPISAGFGSNHYYAGNEGYGYFSAGVDAAYKLAFVPECLGTWTTHAYAKYYNLGEGTKDANVPKIRSVNENEFVFGGGLRVAF